MSDNTRIEWTDSTWNPVTGCNKVSDGCKHCYAERDWGRLANNPKTPHYNGRKFTDVRTRPEVLKKPLQWTRPRRIFVNSMSDLFHPDVPFAFIDQVFAVMGLAKHHTFQVLTKRPERMLEYLTNENRTRDISMAMISKFGHDGTYAGPWPFPNVMHGVTVENQAAADERIPLLLQAPAGIRFLSCEPLLGSVDISKYLKRGGICECSPHINKGERCGKGWILCNAGTRRLDWVIVGGESGPKARPMHPEWVRSLRNQCVDAGTPFLFKQWGEWVPRSPCYHTFDDGSSCFDHDPEAKKWDCVRLTESAGDGSRLERVDGGNDAFMQKVGKKIAGRLLDSREHLEYPEVHR